MKNIISLILINIIFCVLIYSNTYTIAIIPKGSTHEFWTDIEKGAKKAALEFNVNIIFRGPKDDGDTLAQIKLVKTFIEKKVDAIVLAPNHKTDLIPIVKEAISNGIKIIIIDSALDGNYYSSFIATDNLLAGRLAGIELLKLIGNNKKVGIMRYRIGNSSTEMREEGFIQIMKENKVDIIIDEYAGVTGGTAYRKGVEILAKNPDIYGFFTPNESSTLGMAKALYKFNLQKKISLVGFDMSNEIKKYLIKGYIKGVIVQNPNAIGYSGVKTAVEILQGKKINNKIIINTSYQIK